MNNFDTLNSNRLSTLGEGVFADLTDLTLITEEFGQEPDSEFASSLIEYGRFLELAEDAELRVGSADSKPFNGRLYLLNDLIIVGKYRHHGVSKRTLSTSGGSGSNGEKIVFGGGNFDTLHSDDMSDAAESKGSKKKNNHENLKLKLWVDLAGVQVRDMHKNENHGVRIIYTTKETEEVDGELIYVTNVEQTEIWFPDENIMAHFAEKIHDTIDALIEKQLKYQDNISLGSFDDQETATTGPDEETVTGDDDASSVGTKKTGKTGKARSFKSAKATMRKIQKSRNQGKLGTMSKDDGAPISLEALEERYKVSLKPKAQADLAEFTVSFKQGSMGFALSSSEQASGVFVGKLEENGMADIGGVTLGDRVIDIGGQKIDETMNWHHCRDLIIQKRKDVGPDGKPKPLIIKFARVKAVEDNITKENEEKKLNEKKERALRARKKRGGKRAWMENKKKNKSFGSRLDSIKDLERKYLRAGENENTQNSCEDVFTKLFEYAKGDKEETKCVHILKEIHDTEKSYVHSLYLMKDNYIKKLGRKEVQISCKDASLQSNAKFCEHGQAGMYCKKMSSKKAKLMTKDDMKALFMNVEVLAKINENLLQDLQNGLEKLNEVGKKQSISVSDVVAFYAPAFTKIMPFYMMYSQYAANYPKALDRLAELKMSEEFKRELQTIEHQKDVESLQSLLIKPISRLCKYPLLFDQLSEKIRPVLRKIALEAAKTGRGDMDKLSKLVDDLEQTKKMVAKIAETVDYKVGEENKMQILNDIYNELGGVKYIKGFFVPSRKFADRFDDVTLEEKKNNKPVQKKNCVVYVFNDIIIFGRFKNGSRATLTNSSFQNANVNTSKRSVISKNSLTKDNESVVGSKAGSKIGIFGKMAGKNKGDGPAVKIEVGGEPIDIKNCKVKKGHDTDDGKFPVNFYITIKNTPPPTEGKSRNARKNTRKDSKTDNGTLVAGVNKVVVYFEKAAARDQLVECVEAQMQHLHKIEESRKEAKVTMGNARLRLREKRKQIKNRGAVAASSASRQETLKKKLAESRSGRMQEHPVS